MHLLFYNFGYENFLGGRVVPTTQTSQNLLYFTVQFVQTDMKVLRFHFQFVCCVSAIRVCFEDEEMSKSYLRSSEVI